MRGTRSPAETVFPALSVRYHGAAYVLENEGNGAGGGRRLECLFFLAKHLTATTIRLSWFAYQGMRLLTLQFLR